MIHHAAEAARSRTGGPVARYRFGRLEFGRYGTNRRGVQRCCGSRRGTTLIEITVVISLGAVLSGIAVAALASLFQQNRTTTRHVAERGELQRLAVALRQDIHRASGCQWNDDEQHLRLQFPDRPDVVYGRLVDRWVRVAGQADATSWKTAYGLDNTYQCACQPVQARQGDLVRVCFSSQLDPLPAAAPGGTAAHAREAPSLRCEVVAVVGRDRQLGYGLPPMRKTAESKRPSGN